MLFLNHLLRQTEVQANNKKILVTRKIRSIKDAKAIDKVFKMNPSYLDKTW